MEYNIISTGSKGNAVVIDNDILIDCGVTFKALRDVYKGLKLVLLTHIHIDHFNKTTIRKLAQERPTLRFGCCEWLVKPLVDCGVNKANIDVFTPNESYNYELLQIRPFFLVHDVSNCGYKIRIIESNYPESGWETRKIFYATDTSNLNGIEAEDYDLYLIEANHKEAEIAKKIHDKDKAGEFAYERRAQSTHLSQEAAENFICKNIGTNGSYVFLHCHIDKE